ncbi:UNVERIFIED_ORG: hypothetical protein ABIC48_003909 [Burkholderia territorii]
MADVTVWLNIRTVSQRTGKASLTAFFCIEHLYEWPHWKESDLLTPSRKNDTPAMTIDQSSIPHYVVVLGGWRPYVLNIDRIVIRRDASRLLLAFARTRGKLECIDGDDWNTFSETQNLSAPERREARFYALVKGTETEHQLRLLAIL